MFTLIAYVRCFLFSELPPTPTPTTFDSESALLSSPLPNICSAIFRSLFVLVNWGSLKTRRKTASLLRNPPTYHLFRCALNSINYGIRTSLTDSCVSIDDSTLMTHNFLILTQTLLTTPSLGPDHSLAALEVYEVMLTVISDICEKLAKLCIGRNQDATIPVHNIRQLHENECALMATTVQLLSILIEKVSQVTFFVGNTEWVSLCDMF